MSNLLVIIDMLNDFIKPEGKLYFERGQAVAAPISRLKATFRGAGRPVVYANDAHPEDSAEFAVWPPHCVVGSWGARIIDELPPGPNDVVFHKDALTVFAAPTAEPFLRGLGVSHLYLVGVATEYCVRSCALDARRHGFDVTVVGDAIASVDLTPGDGERALDDMRRAGVSFADAVSVGSIFGG